MVQAIPEGVSPIVPHLSIRGAKKAIEFYQAAFGAEVLTLMPMGDELVGYADLKIGTARIYLADATPGWGPVQAPTDLKGTTVTMHLWVEDVDAVFARAVASGAVVVMPVADQFWGDRYALVADPFGHTWAIATRKEDLTAEEMMRRGQEAMAHMPPPPAPKPKSKPGSKLKKKGLPPSVKSKVPAKPSPKAAEVKVTETAKPEVATRPPEAKDAKKLKKDKKDRKDKKAKKDKSGKKSKKDKKRKKKSKR